MVIEIVDDYPLNMVIFHSYVNVYQRVNMGKSTMLGVGDRCTPMGHQATQTATLIDGHASGNWTLMLIIYFNGLYIYTIAMLNNQRAYIYIIYIYYDTLWLFDIAMDILYIHIHHYKNALQNAHAQRAFFWLTLPGKATLFDDSHLFGIYSFISHVGFSTRGVHKETQNKYGHIVSPWEIMMKHDKNDFRDNTFSDKSGCDFKLSQNQLV